MSERELALLVGGLNVGIGALLCFGGYAAWRLVLFINGFAVGLVLGVVVAQVNRAQQPLAIGAVSGLACAIVFASIVPLGTFLLIVLGSVTTAIEFANPQSTRELTNAAATGAVLGCFPALIALAWPRPVLIVITSLAGGLKLMTGALFFAVLSESVQTWSRQELNDAVVYGTIGLFALGLAVQFLSTKPGNAANPPDGSAPPEPGSANTPSAVQVQASRAPIATPELAASVEGALVQLKRMHSAGLIETSDFETRRSRLLDDLTGILRSIPENRDGCLAEDQKRQARAMRESKFLLAEDQTYHAQSCHEVEPQSCILATGEYAEAHEYKPAPCCIAPAARR